MNFKNLLKRFFALVLVLVCVSVSIQVVASEETNDQVYLLGNCASSGMDNAQIFGFGDGLQHTFGGATLLTLDALQAKATSIVGIRVYIGAEVETGKVILGADYEKPEIEKEFTYKKGGWQYVLFDEPYNFTADTYIGFLATGTTDFLALEASKKTSKTEAINIDGTWDLISNQLGKYVWAIQAIVAGGDYSAEVQKDVVLERATVSKNPKAGESIVLACELRNAGILPAENVVVKCTLGEEIKTINISEKLMNGQSAFVEFADFVAPEIEGVIENVSIEFVAEYTDDSIATNNATKATLSVYSSKTVDRNAILVEQFTGQDCGYCPGGAEVLKGAIAGMKNPEKVIWVAHHFGYREDSFTLDESVIIGTNLGVEGAPSCAVDRMVVDFAPGQSDLCWHPGYATTDLLEELVKTPGLATINAVRDYNADTRKLSVNVTGTSLLRDAYITVLVKQSGIVARQSNGGSNYVHNNAPRLFLTGANGDKLNVAEDGSYSASFECEIPEYVGVYGCKGELDVVVFVHGELKNRANRMVFNADQESIDVISDVEYSYTEDMSIYPNPAVDVLYVEGMTAGDVVRVYTIDGILAAEYQISVADASINVSGLSAGTYFLQVNEKVVKFIKK